MVGLHVHPALKEVKKVPKKRDLFNIFWDTFPRWQKWPPRCVQRVPEGCTGGLQCRAGRARCRSHGAQKSQIGSQNHPTSMKNHKKIGSSTYLFPWKSEINCFCQKLIKRGLPQDQTWKPLPTYIRRFGTKRSPRQCPMYNAYFNFNAYCLCFYRVSAISLWLYYTDYVLH